jgi:hypothetical protein
MAWRSLFAFDNPNGEVGRQYSATSTITINQQIPISATDQFILLATFSNLPIGVYSVSTQVLIDWGDIAVITAAYIGLSQSLSPLEIFPSTTLVAVQATNISNVLPITQNANFVISVTNANPYYIYLQVNNQSAISLFKSTATSIATKLA